MRYQFTPELATGNTIIDAEHKSLLEAVDDLMSKITAGQGQESVVKATTFLVDYTKKHFKHEEELQEKNNFPEMPNHKIWHKNYLDVLDKLSDKIKVEGPTNLIVLDLIKAMGDLVSHIKTFDKRLADYLKK